MLAFLVDDHLLADLGEPRPFCDDRDVAVHLAIDLDGFHHILLVGLEPAVEVVELDARHSARGPVEELRRDVLG